MQEITNLIVAIILIIVFLYGTISLLVFFILTNNPFLWRKGASKFPYPVVLKYTYRNKTAYYIHKQENSKGWVVLLHYYVGKSESMAERGKYYIDNGYSALFVDGPSHGLSKFSLRATGVHYATNVLEIIEKEEIRNPILHGVSFGSTACIFLSKMIVYKALILESSPCTLKDIYWSLFHYIKIPKWLFGWIPYIIFFRYRDFDWERNDPFRLLKFTDAPTLIFHTKKDRIFDYKVHSEVFNKIFSEKSNKFGKFITIEDAAHTEIDKEPLFLNELSKII